jgi:hypothetical protein
MPTHGRALKPAMVCLSRPRRGRETARAATCIRLSGVRAAVPPSSLGAGESNGSGTLPSSRLVKLSARLDVVLVLELRLRKRRHCGVFLAVAALRIIAAARTRFNAPRLSSQAVPLQSRSRFFRRRVAGVPRIGVPGSGGVVAGRIACRASPTPPQCAARRGAQCDGLPGRASARQAVLFSSAGGCVHDARADSGSTAFSSGAGRELALAQLDPPDLAREGLWQVVDELDLPRIGVRRETAADEGLDVFA